ncbi:MAG TPA: histidinol dehydrogenase [Candidatus Gastranaerophilales bacterium]|nr:histidinol dehydrogenase [Candidatus Gastranaerophilales bacterium]
MKIIKYSDLKKDFFEYQEFIGIESVKEIIRYVKIHGDEAVKKYSRQFGDGEISSIELTAEEIENACEKISEDTKNYIKLAINNVKNFAEAQFSVLKNIETVKDGIRLGHRVIPLERIGAYVPGGNYPLPSSAIMSIVPAKVAGVKEVIVCSPRIQPATIVACKLAGADRIFRIGGVQAVAAMAYGTESVPAVNKIVGPGNKYVTAAKKEVYGICGIDFLAGPSEVMIIADQTADYEFIAADMLAQCEHDPDARAYLITTSADLAEKVIQKTEYFLKTLTTSEIASKAIRESIVIIIENIGQGVEIANKKAPEHLEICYKDCQNDLDKYTNYGSLFIGNYSAEVFGDYCSGTNHILPTNGVAKYSGGLSVFDFVKIQTYQEIYPEAATNLSKIASNLANTEGLYAHKLSADLRADSYVFRGSHNYFG